MNDSLWLILVLSYALHRELRIRQLKAVLNGALSRKDGMCAVAKVSAACHRRLLEGKPCVSAEKSLKPPVRILVDELTQAKSRVKRVSDLRGDGALPASGLSIISSDGEVRSAPAGLQFIKVEQRAKAQ